jgi:hypothetical protein
MVRLCAFACHKFSWTMKFVAAVLLVLFAAPLGTCFVTRATFGPRVSSINLSDGNTGKYLRNNSGLEGNQRKPSPQELSIMDEMITKLANAKPYDLPNAVRRAFRVCSSPQFFMRIAERVDEARDASEIEKLSAFASNLVATLEAVVETTEETLDERAKNVEIIVKAAAEPDSGEFFVPLAPQRVDAMFSVMLELPVNELDEGFLSTIDAWTQKSFEDGMDGMVTILQKVLQIYAGLQVKRAREQLGLVTVPTPATDLLESLLMTDTDRWDMEIRKGFSVGDETLSSGKLISEIQKTMESVVLGLDNGSMAQRVQAEYLRELLTRVETLQK